MQPRLGRAYRDDAVGADADVRADEAVDADLGGRVDQHVADKAVARGEAAGALGPDGGQVQLEACIAPPGKTPPQRRPAPHHRRRTPALLALLHVVGLADVHPVAGEGHGEEAAVLGDLGEDLALDGGRPQGDPTDHLGVQDIDACECQWILS